MRGRQDSRGTYNYSTVRNVATWPFSQNSIWNTPIGSGAVYGLFYGTINAVGGENPTPGIQPPGINLDGNAMPIAGNGLYVSHDDNWIINASASDPLVTVYKQTGWVSGRCASTTLVAQYSGGPTPWQTHLPSSFTIPDPPPGQTPNANFCGINPDGSTFHGNVAARCVAGGAFYETPLWMYASIDPTVLAADASIYSTGIYGGHGGSGMSAYGGCLMVGELTGPGPIHHALSLDINGAEYLFYDPSTHLGRVWPAPTQDAAAGNSDYYGGYHGHYPAVRMGSLLAVPPSVTEASLGLTLRPTKKIFHALQDYGAYIVDDCGFSAVLLNVQDSARDEFANYYGYGLYAGKPASGYVVQPFYDELMSIYGSLQVISNNGPSSIGGGGTPRVPLAPPFGT